MGAGASAVTRGTCTSTRSTASANTTTTRRLNAARSRALRIELPEGIGGSARHAAFEEIDARVIVHPRRQLGPVVVDDEAARQRRVHLERLHEIESEPAAQEVVIVLLDHAVRVGGQVAVQLDVEVVDQDV